MSETLIDGLIVDIKKDISKDNKNLGKYICWKLLLLNKEDEIFEREHTLNEIKTIKNEIKYVDKIMYNIQHGIIT